MLSFQATSTGMGRTPSIESWGHICAIPSTKLVTNNKLKQKKLKYGQVKTPLHQQKFWWLWFFL